MRDTRRNGGQNASGMVEVPQHTVDGTVGGLLAALTVIAVSVAMVLTAFGFNAEARRLPIVVGVPTALLATVLLIGETFSLARNGNRTKDMPADRDFARVMKPLVSFILFIVSIISFGVLVGTAIFSAAFLWLSGSMRFLPSMLFSIATVAAMYLASVALQIPLYLGHVF